MARCVLDQGMRRHTGSNHPAATAKHLANPKLFRLSSTDAVAHPDTRAKFHTDADPVVIGFTQCGPDRNGATAGPNRRPVYSSHRSRR